MAQTRQSRPYFGLGFSGESPGKYLGCSVPARQRLPRRRGGRGRVLSRVEGRCTTLHISSTSPDHAPFFITWTSRPRPASCLDYLKCAEFVRQQFGHGARRRLESALVSTACCFHLSSHLRRRSTSTPRYARASRPCPTRCRVQGAGCRVQGSGFRVQGWLHASRPCPTRCLTLNS